MRIAHYLPAHHRNDCPAWDHWPCECGAKPIPLVLLSDALEAVALAQEPPGEPSRKEQP
jgi:hypothetical protein